VINASLAFSEDNRKKPEARVRLDFPFAASGVPLQATVVFWSTDKDIAGLQLDIPATGSAIPLPLVQTEEMWGRRFRTLGFPSDYEQTGIWVAGVLRSNIANDWIQIETAEAGFPIGPGFSGCPICDDKEGGVVGMLVTFDRRGRGAFVLPTSTIVTTWPDVQPVRPVPLPQPVPPESFYRIFLCYGSEDENEVRELCARLKSDGFDVWFDEDELLPGQCWELKIREALRRSQAVIVCFSRKSVGKTGFVQKERRMALDLADERPQDSVFLIPARLDECILPDRLAGFQCADLFKENGYEKLVRTLRLIGGGTP